MDDGGYEGISDTSDMDTSDLSDAPMESDMGEPEFDVVGADTDAGEASDVNLAESNDESSLINEVGEKPEQSTENDLVEEAPYGVNEALEQPVVEEKELQKEPPATGEEEPEQTETNEETPAEQDEIPEVEEAEEILEEEQEEEQPAPINAKYANGPYPLEEKNPELSDKYPEGVNFTSDGYPDFSPYAIETVEIDVTGDRIDDFTSANEAAGLEEKPEGFTWHHKEDGKTMELIPTDLHQQVAHTGGVSVVKNAKKE